MASYTDYSERINSLNQVVKPHPDYVRQTYGKQTFALTLAATTSGVAAGNIVGATAAAAAQFALTNPSTSNRNLVLVKFFMGIISGTPAPGPLFHGVISTNPTLTSIGGTIVNCFLGDSTVSVATPHSLAGGSALTGGSAPTIIRSASFSTTATAQASPGAINCLEVLNGDIIIPPGKTWVPLWSVAGTSLLNAYSIVWYEMGL